MRAASATLEKKISRAQNVHNMTSVCACACVHRFDFGLCRVFLRSFLYFSTSFYGFLFYYCVTFLLRCTYICRPKHFIAQASFTLRLMPKWENGWKSVKSFWATNKEREIEWRKKHKHDVKGVLRLSFSNTCKFTTHSKELCRILSHFSSRSFSICCFRVRC